MTIAKRVARSVLRSPRQAVAGAIVPLAFGILVGCGDYGGGGGSGAGAAASDPPASDPGPQPANDPGASVAAFESTVYPLLRQNCESCHAGAGPGSPHIAHPDVAAAFQAVVDNQKVNFATPSSSRLVRRLVADFHHCWSSCVADGAVMQAAVEAWADAIVQGGGATQVQPGLASTSLTLADGFEDEGEQRYQDHVIALWEFKEGSGEVARDTSGVAPAMDLALEGPTWMSNYGISIESGMAIADAEASRKIYDRIAEPVDGTQQYSVEAWVIPDNVDQEGPARIVSYSGGTSRRNFTLGQVLYTYDFRNRSMNPEVSDNGTPSLQTYDGDQDLQATRQHVVVTYDQFRGGRVYVNGRWTDDLDPSEASRLWNWDFRHRVVFGNETSGDRPWIGKIQLVAIHDLALTDTQIRQNFDAGVGLRLILRFDVSRWAGPGSFVEFTVSELDDYSYLFCEPTFATPNPSGFRVSNLRIAVNGQVPVSGQAFVNVDQPVLGERQKLSQLCSVVPKDQGPESDVFTVEFEVLGDYQNPIVAGPPPQPPPDAFGPPLPREGVRDFARIHQAMAALTGVDPAEPGVSDTFEGLAQQLPGDYDLRAFSSSHQVGIAKLALEYCDALVESPVLRDGFFGAGFGFDQPADQVFASRANRDQLIDALSAGMLGESLASQPSRAELQPILDTLFDELTASCGVVACGPERTRTVVKSACAAVLGSAAVSIH